MGQKIIIIIFIFFNNNKILFYFLFLISIIKYNTLQLKKGQQHLALHAHI